MNGITINSQQMIFEPVLELSFIFIHFKLQCHFYQWVSLIVSVHSNRYEAWICDLIKSLGILPDFNEQGIDLLITKSKSLVIRIIGGNLSLRHCIFSMEPWCSFVICTHSPSDIIRDLLFNPTDFHPFWKHPLGPVLTRVYFNMTIHRQPIVVVRYREQKFGPNYCLFHCSVVLHIWIHSQNWMIFIFQDFVSNSTKFA